MRVWSDGADPAGRSFRVGFEIRNNAEPDLIFRPGEAVLRFSDFEVDLKPRESKEIIVAAGQSLQTELSYPLPGRFKDKAAGDFDIRWSVHRGAASPPVHVTHFTRAPSRLYTPKPLDSSEPIDREHIERTDAPPPFGVPIGPDPSR